MVRRAWVALALAVLVSGCGGAAPTPAGPTAGPAGTPIAGGPTPAGDGGPETTSDPNAPPIPDLDYDPAATPEPTDVPLVADNDGVADDVEVNAGDANGDGLDDAQQGNVASLPSGDFGYFMTLAVDAPMSLTGVASVATPQADTKVQFPFGAVGATIEGVAVGGTAELEVFLPFAGISPGAYWKQDPAGAWSAFTWDGTTGARVYGPSKVLLVMQDGGRGDADGTANGRIVDPGAPAVTGNSGPELHISFKRTIKNPWQVDFLIDGTRDPDGNLRYVQIEFGDGDKWEATLAPGENTFPVPSHVYETSDTFSVRFTAIDDEGAATVSDSLVVVPPPFSLRCVPARATFGPVPHRFSFKLESSWDTAIEGFEGQTTLNVPNELFAGVEVDVGDGNPPLRQAHYENEFIHIYKKTGHFTLTARMGIKHPITKQVALTASCQMQVIVSDRPANGTATINIEQHGTYTSNRGNPVELDSSSTATMYFDLVRDEFDETTFNSTWTVVSWNHTMRAVETGDGCTVIESASGGGTYEGGAGPSLRFGWSAPDGTLLGQMIDETKYVIHAVAPTADVPEGDPRGWYRAKGDVCGAYSLGLQFPFTAFAFADGPIPAGSFSTLSGSRQRELPPLNPQLDVPRTETVTWTINMPGASLP